MPQRGELHAVKILNDPKNILAFLNGDTDKFLTSENFQRKFMHEYPKLLWNSEKIDNMGELVMLFPNPAKLEDPTPLTISFDEAEDHFDDIFETSYMYPFKKKFITALKEAFNEAFLDLDMVPPEKKKEEEKTKPENQEANQLQTPEPNQDKSLAGSPKSLAGSPKMKTMKSLSGGTSPIKKSVSLNMEGFGGIMKFKQNL